ncbi:hypothetical protein OROMI_003126 [Orobanche minor]
MFLYSERWFVEPSEIVWRTNHVDTNGQFVNDKAKETYVRETIMIEADILEVVLGHQSGYIKRMGSGVKVPHVSKRLRAQETESSKDIISSLTMKLEQQKEDNKNNKELISILTAEIESIKEKIQSLTTHEERFSQFMLKFHEFSQSCI